LELRLRNFHDVTFVNFANEKTRVPLRIFFWKYVKTLDFKLQAFNTKLEPF
jgi:hypothetical protein